MAEVGVAHVGGAAGAVRMEAAALTGAVLTDTKSCNNGPLRIGAGFFLCPRGLLMERRPRNSQISQVFIMNERLGPFLIGHRENAGWSDVADEVHTRSMGSQASGPTK